MSREQEEEFYQDRSGNVRRKIDPVRGQDGMTGGASGTDGFTAFPSGLAAIPSDETGFQIPLYTVRPGDGLVSVNEIHIHNNGSSEGTYQLYDCIGTNPGLSQTHEEELRTIPISVEAGSTRIVSYTGQPFGLVNKRQGTNSEPRNFGGILVEGTQPGKVGVGVYSHSEEEVEPSSEKDKPRPDGYELQAV